MKAIRISPLLPGTLLTCLMLLSAPGVQAAAFYISEFGTPGSLGTAGVANTTNTFGADSAFTNPAGMTGLEQDTIVSGMQALIPEIKFDSSIAEAGGKEGVTQVMSRLSRASSPSTTMPSRAQRPCLTARSNWRTWTTGACSRLWV